MFTTRHYRVLAGVLHKSFATPVWKEVYENVYKPLCEELKADNPNFNVTAFGYYVASGEDIPAPTGGVIR